MQLLDYIHQLEEYFKAEHGLTINVQISIHTTDNESLNDGGFVAYEVGCKLAQEIGGEVRVWSHDKTNGVSCGEYDRRVTLFFEEANDA